MVIFFLVNLLGRHVVRRAHMSVGKDRLVPHDSAEPEITQLDVALAVYKYISRFEIPMKYFAVLSSMTLKQPERHLRQDLPGHLLRNELFGFFASLNEGGHIALLAELHNDVNSTFLFVDYSVVIAHDVGVAKLS